MRTDAAALYVLDTSLSMRAAAPRTRPTASRRRAASRSPCRPRCPTSPPASPRSPTASCPTCSRQPKTAAFASTVTDAVAINAPPPRDENTRATTFAALGEAAAPGFFPKAATRRVLIVVTDGESRPFDAAGLAQTLASRPATKLVAIRVGRFRRPHLAGREGRPGVHAGRGCRPLAHGAHERDRRARERPRRGRAAVRAALGRGHEARQGTTAGRSAPRALSAGVRARAAGCSPARAQLLVVRSATSSSRARVPIMSRETDRSSTANSPAASLEARDPRRAGRRGRCCDRRRDRRQRRLGRSRGQLDLVRRDRRPGTATRP